MIEGILHLQDIGYKTTFNITRDPVELLDEIEEKWGLLISPDILVGLENGGRVGRSQRKEGNVIWVDEKVNALSLHDITLIIDTIKKNHVKGIKFYTGNESVNQLAWVSEKKYVDDVKNKFVLASEVLTCSLDELKEILLKYTPAYLTILGNCIVPNKLNYFLVRNEYNFNAIGIDKSTALKLISKKCHIDLKKSLSAGDSSPDIAMLVRNEVGTVVMVGRELIKRENTKYVGDARELGRFLMRM